MCSWRSLRDECVDCEAVPEDRLPRHGAWPFKSPAWATHPGGLGHRGAKALYL